MKVALPPPKAGFNPFGMFKDPTREYDAWGTLASILAG